MRWVVLDNHLWQGVRTVLDLSKGRGTAWVKIGAGFTYNKLRIM